MPRVAAVNIGAAIIRGHGADGTTVASPFRLRSAPHELSTVLSALFGRLGSFDVLAVGLSCGVCEGFQTRTDAVRHTLAAVKAAAVRCCPSLPAPGRKRGWPDILVWRADGGFAPLAEALGDPQPTGAGDWLALALIAGRLVPEGPAVLVDVGWTSVEIVPLEGGVPAPRAYSATDRLATGELLYAGVARTPVSALMREIPFRGRSCPVVSEPFATTRDAYIVLGLLPEDPTDTETTDGEPATRSKARERLARMVAAEPGSFTDEDASESAAAILSEQGRRLLENLRKLGTLNDPAHVAAVISGPGEFLARSALESTGVRVVSLAETMGERISTVAPAYALWRLATESVPGGASGGASTCP